MQRLLQQLLTGAPLSLDQARTLMNAWLAGSVPEVVTGAILAALQLKGLTVEELTGFAQVLREQSLDPLGIRPLVDTCGTGGSGTQSFNISTAVAFVGAACGLRVAKHGNRSASGTVGSADVLEYLGVNLQAPLSRVREAVEQVGVTFVFAPGWHPALKAVAPLRKQLGVRTVFNLLGPLVNPLAPTAQVLGITEPRLVRTMAQALYNLGLERGLALHGQEGLDEAGLAGPTTVVGFDRANQDGEQFWEEVIKPTDFGLAPAPTSQIRGGTVAENAQILREVLQGKGTVAQRDIVLLNSSAALQVGGLATDWAQGIDLARACLASGAAWDKVTALVLYLEKQLD